MVAAVRSGESIRSVAKRFRVGRSTVWRWVHRSRTRLDRSDFAGRSPGSAPAHNRVHPDVEAEVLRVRRELQETSALGEFGDVAIRRALAETHAAAIPSVSTIARILRRHGALSRGQRVRRPAPPRGWYLPRSADGDDELDSFDVIEGLTSSEDKHYEVLTGISLRGRLASAWPMRQVTTEAASACLIERWGEFGRPRFAQFDNDTIFQGAHFDPDTFGRVIRLCMSLDVTAVFAPPREHGMQNAIESFNGLWQQKVRDRFRPTSLREAVTRSERYIAAHRGRHADPGVARRPMEPGWRPEARPPLRGLAIFLRRADEDGWVSLLGRRFEVTAAWAHRLLRCEVDLDHSQIRFVGLRRQTPAEQPRLGVVEYRPEPGRRRCR